MTRIWPGPFYVAPFLALGARRRVMFPDTGTDIPFRIENYAYIDSFGRETLTWARAFQFEWERRFDETLIYSERRGRAVVYAGDHQHLAVDLDLSVGAGGSFVLKTGAQRLYEWPIAIRFPGFFSGTAHVEESYDDGENRFKVTVAIANRFFGPIFGYEGWFRLEWREAGEIPAYARPVREERRE